MHNFFEINFLFSIEVNVRKNLRYFLAISLYSNTFIIISAIQIKPQSTGQPVQNLHFIQTPNGQIQVRGLHPGNNLTLTLADLVGLNTFVPRFICTITRKTRKSMQRTGMVSLSIFQETAKKFLLI